MHYFDPVTVRYDGLLPTIAPHNLAIQLDRDTFFWQRKLPHQIIETGVASRLAIFSVHSNVQTSIPADEFRELKRQDDSA